MLRLYLTHYSDVCHCPRQGFVRYMNYKFEFPKWFAACEVVSLTSVVFVFHQCLFVLAAAFCQADQGGRGRQAGRGGLWISLNEPTDSSASADSDWAMAIVASLGGKGAKCLSIITGCSRSQDTPPPLHSTPASAVGTVHGQIGLLTFSKIAWNIFWSAGTRARLELLSSH